MRGKLLVGEVWTLKTNGERWRIEESRGNGEYLVRALDGPHKGKTDAVFGAEIKRAANPESRATEREDEQTTKGAGS